MNDHPPRLVSPLSASTDHVCTLHKLLHLTLRSKVRPPKMEVDGHGNGRRTLPLSSYPTQGPAKVRRENQPQYPLAETLRLCTAAAGKPEPPRPDDALANDTHR